jgi:hypothetical protein
MSENWKDLECNKKTRTARLRKECRCEGGLHGSLSGSGRGGEDEAVGGTRMRVDQRLA